MGKRVRRQVASDNVIDFQQYHNTQHRQRYNSRPRNKTQEEYLLKLQDDTKNIIFATA